MTGEFKQGRHFWFLISTVVRNVVFVDDGGGGGGGAKGALGAKLLTPNLRTEGQLCTCTRGSALRTLTMSNMRYQVEIYGKSQEYKYIYIYIYIITKPSRTKLVKEIHPSKHPASHGMYGSDCIKDVIIHWKTFEPTFA